MGVFAALGTTLCWSLGIFPFTEAAQRFGTAALNQYRLFLAWIFIFIIACIYFGCNPLVLAVGFDTKTYFYLGLSGIIGFTVGDFFTFNSFRILGPKLSSLYTTLAPFSALVFGMIFLNEKINGIGVSAILLTMVSVIGLTLSKQDKAQAKSRGFERNIYGIISGIVGAFCQGCGLVFSKIGMQEGETNVQPLQAVWVRLLFAFSTAMLMAFLTKNFVKNSRAVFTNQNGGFKFMMAGTLLGPVCGVTGSLIAVTYMKVAEAQTVFALLPVFVLPLNYFIYREKIKTASVLTSITAIGGVMILIWRNEMEKILFF